MKYLNDLMLRDMLKHGTLRERNIGFMLHELLEVLTDSGIKIPDSESKPKGKVAPETIPCDLAVEAMTALRDADIAGMFSEDESLFEEAFDCVSSALKDEIERHDKVLKLLEAIYRNKGHARKMMNSFEELQQLLLEEQE